MNLFISQQRLKARFIPAVAIVALLLSAFPASFFVAEAVSEATYVITGHKYECINDGEGTDCSTPVAGWEVFAQNAETMDRVYATTTVSGAYSIEVPRGIWEVYEVVQATWEQYEVIKNGDPVEGNACRFNFGDVEEGGPYTFLSSSVALAASEEANGTCDFGNKRTLVPIELCKYTPGVDLSHPVPVAGWKMKLTTVDPNEDVAESSASSAATESLVTQANGCVSKVVDSTEGPWYAYEESVDGWRFIDLEPTNGGFNAESGTPYCYFFGKTREYSSEGSDYRCSFYNEDMREPATGFKWSDENNNGIKDAGDQGVRGWKITATDMSERPLAPVSTVTASDGSYTLLLPPEGYWKITEESRLGWTQKAVYQNSEKLILGTEETADITACTMYLGDRASKSAMMLDLDIISAPAAVTNSCDFLNYQTPRTGGSSGTRVKDRTPSVPTGEVLGASTSTPQCSVYLNEYMRQGNAASTTEVTKLQIFMNAVGIKLEITGAFDAATDAAVRTFQTQHKAEVLTPWYTAKIVPHENPTGWVYQLTRWKINNIVCPGSEAYPVLN